MCTGLKETGGPKNPQHEAVRDPIVLLEYFNWALESRNIWRAKGDDKRARGYERLVEQLPSLLLELGIELLEE